MAQEKIAFDRLDPARPPAVVLGDLSLIRPIAMSSIPQILVTSEPDDIALRSRCLSGYRIVPAFVERHGLDRCAEELVDLGVRLAQRLGRRVPLFYNSDNHLELIYRHRAALEEQYLMLLNDEDVAWSLHDKARFYSLAQRAGVRVPTTVGIGADGDRDLSGLHGPVLVKPKRKNTWRGIRRDLFEGRGKARVFSTIEDLLAHPDFARHKDGVVVQEYIGGQVSSLYSFHGFADERGRLLASYCGRKIRTYPQFAGESSFIELVHEQSVDAEGRSVAARLGLKGPFKIDLMRDERSGELYTLETNARFNLWNHLGAAEGVNLLAIAYDYLVYGRAPRSEPPYAPRCRWVNFYRDYQAYKELRHLGEIGLGSWLGSLASAGVVYETFAWSDPAPFVQWAGEFLRGLVQQPNRSGRSGAGGVADELDEVGRAPKQLLDEA